MIFAKGCLVYLDEPGIVTRCLGALLVPAFLCGVAGIILAFQGNRKRALLAGCCASGIALCFLTSLCLEVMFAPPDVIFVEFPERFWLGLVSLGAAFWAVLLAFLIPGKIDRPNRP
jgi:hypothetical protein